MSMNILLFILCLSGLCFFTAFFCNLLRDYTGWKWLTVAGRISVIFALFFAGSFLLGLLLAVMVSLLQEAGVLHLPATLHHCSPTV